MPTILGRFIKQPGETLDYDVDYTDWFTNRADAPASFTATVDTGITMVSSSRSGNVIRVVLAGGTAGATYKVTTRMTTNAAVPITKEAEFTVKVKEV